MAVLAGLLATGVPLLGAAGQVRIGRLLSGGLVERVRPAAMLLLIVLLCADMQVSVCITSLGLCLFTFLLAARRLLPRHGPADRGLPLRPGHGATGLRVSHCCHCLQVGRAKCCLIWGGGWCAELQAPAVADHLCQFCCALLKALFLVCFQLCTANQPTIPPCLCLCNSHVWCMLDALASTCYSPP